MAGKVELRMATLVLLMISDLDFMFSYLFIFVLHQTWIVSGNIVYLALLIVVLLGQAVYIVGVGYFGPRQKDQIAQQVKDFMLSNPDKTITEKWREIPGRPGRYEPVSFKEQGIPGAPVLMITMDFPVVPIKDQGARGQQIKKFNQLDLENDPNDREQMQIGLGVWGLQDIWDGVEQKNAWNCLKASHGVPLWRLAQYGFQSQPFPKDLSGILNANALYTFACGFVQLVGGVIILMETWDSTGISAKVTCMVPWLVSFVSAVLSIVNVVKDFSGMLVQMENEEDLQKKIMVKHDKESREQKERLEAAHKEKKQQIEAACAEGLHDSDEELAAKQADKLTKLQDQTDRFVCALDEVQTNGLMILELELRAYRMKLKRVRDLLSGKVPLQREDDQAKGAKLERAMEKTKIREEFFQALDDQRNAQMKALTDKVSSGELDASKLADEVKLINTQYEEMKKVGAMV